MPPPDDGNEYTPFEELIQVKHLGNNKYASIALPYATAGLPRSYGGHVFAQAAWTACYTVEPGFLIKSVSGVFLLPGLCNTRFIYEVQVIGDGPSSCTRVVNVIQVEGKGIAFTCTISFVRPEESALDVQAEVDIWSKYDDALRFKPPPDFPEAPGMDLPWYWKHLREKLGGKPEPFPGIDSRQVNMTPYNSPRHPLERRQIMFYRSLGTVSNDPNLHLCGHLYASDRNSLFVVTNHCEVAHLIQGIGSLTHTMTFHTSAEHADLGEDHGLKHATWFCREGWTDRVAGGRGTFHGRIWSPSGVHIATIVQDGLVRIPAAAKKEIEQIRTGWPKL